ncbi:hypothetical protein BBK14_33540 [Parafrankia soli]|uniref:Uncharacterized protein n=1 Tax=Parafrankia soli TaxID=2599596 RepID=A0A1S1QMB3_9ACTN|nr:hypothetical protein [Parafrankia soli]OHV34726.1 hypothetical protein BBK14_33540 [Parafrankia soli]
MNEIVLTESRAARGEYAGHTDALDRVKALGLLPDDLHVTTEMVAGYFEVGVEAIKSVIKRHRDELIENGLLAVRGGDLAALKAELAGQGSEVQAEPHWDRISALALFTRRTVLNVAMLLVDSDVARQVRRALLDRYEQPVRPVAAPALDATETESRLRLLGVARRAGGLNVEEVRSATRALLDPWGLVHPDWQPLASARTRAEEVAAWMRRRYAVGDTVSLREAYHGLDGRRWCRRVADLEPVFDELVTGGHLGRVPRPAERGRGRPPSPRFEVLPVPRHLAVVGGGDTDTPAPYAPTGGAS